MHEPNHGWKGSAGIHKTKAWRYKIGSIMYNLGIYQIGLYILSIVCDGPVRLRCMCNSFNWCICIIFHHACRFCRLSFGTHLTLHNTELLSCEIKSNFSLSGSMFANQPAVWGVSDHKLYEHNGTSCALLNEVTYVCLTAIVFLHDFIKTKWCTWVLFVYTEKLAQFHGSLFTAVLC